MPDPAGEKPGNCTEKRPKKQRQTRFLERLMRWFCFMQYE
jgi:hypothetical protein